MEKLNIFKKLLGVTMLVCGCLLISNSAFADMVSNAGLIPAGYGYTHGRIPVIEATANPEDYDQAIMRYDRNSRIKDIDSSMSQYGEASQSQDNSRQEF